MADTSQVKEITSKLEQGVKDLFTSERFADYLRTMSRFHKYSTRNTLLIHMQKPDATLVAGFRAWQTKFGRSVKKGEKSIKILAPVPFIKREEKEKLDPDTRQPIIGADGLPVVEYTEQRLARFKVTSVFDASQTSGKPLPTLAQDLIGNVEQYEAFMDALRAVSPLPVVFEKMPENQDGTCRYGKEIAIREGMSEIQTVCAVIHEMTHAKLHDKSLKVDADGGDKPKDRRTEELEAEAVSYSVCQFFGIETGDNSFGYLAEWSKSRDLKELNASLDTIRKAAAELIDEIDGKFREIVKERDINIVVGEAQEESAMPEAAKQSPFITPEADREAIIRRIMDYILKDDPGHPVKSLQYIELNMRRKPIEDLCEFDFAFYFPGETPPLVKTEQELSTPSAARTENKLYEKFTELFPQIATGEYDYLRFEAGGGMEPLSLEWIGQNQISVMHTYTQNGDLCYDPMVVFDIDNSAGTMTALEFEQSIPPLYQRVDEDGNGNSIDGNGNEREIKGLQASINSFAAQWFDNIGEQGYRPARANMRIDGETTQVVFNEGGEPILPVPEKEREPNPTEQELMMPDPSVGYAEMNLYGYLADDMYPLTANRAIELFNSDHTIYLLYPDNTEMTAFDTDEIITFSSDGLCGITHADWELSPVRAAQSAEAKNREGSREAELLYGSENRFGIYQVKDGADFRDFRFASAEELRVRDLEIDRDNYELVYSAPLSVRDAQTNLHKIFNDYNGDAKPQDYTARSVSTSDVIVLQWRGDVSSHFVDSAGFVKIDAFLGNEKQTGTIVEMPEPERKPEVSESYSQLGNSPDGDPPAASKGRLSLAERLAENKLKAAQQGQPDAHKNTEREARV